jgi:PhnB protein
MKLNTYVNFAGKCTEAFRFYEKHLGGQIGMMTRGQLPDQSHVKPESKDAVVHARISIGDTEIMGADVARRSADAERIPVTKRPE